jgi:hypothetical protein
VIVLVIVLAIVLAIAVSAELAVLALNQEAEPISTS